MIPIPTCILQKHNTDNWKMNNCLSWAVLSSTKQSFFHDSSVTQLNSQAPRWSPTTAELTLWSPSKIQKLSTPLLKSSKQANELLTPEMKSPNQLHKFITAQMKSPNQLHKLPTPQLKSPNHLHKFPTPQLKSPTSYISFSLGPSRAANSSYLAASGLQCLSLLVLLVVSHSNFSDL